ncbi:MULTISPECIES: DUF2269 family protein [Pseudomonas]|uniref:DUF2269 domain-containing protein n=1 Tax=Pseudomonas eucalypticola TaxID=2599595 RepID=A0A7D5H745_9PSED|nr:MULTISPECIES: DUF2269 family protein [Pseudomonas]QKZ07342.1 DUF2269 domain-containing protein [Pseudomonas eucalypticola]
METLSLLKMLHGIATALLLGSVAAVLFQTWRGWRAGNKSAFAQTLQRPWLYAWVLMGLSVASFPFTGWWMMHTVGWPLGQAWLLGGSVLYVVGVFGFLLLLRRTIRWRQAAAAYNQVQVVRQRKLAAVFAGVSLVVLVAILVLMLAKPV